VYTRLAHLRTHIVHVRHNVRVLYLRAAAAVRACLARVAYGEHFRSGQRRASDFRRRRNVRRRRHRRTAMSRRAGARNPYT